MRMKKKHLKVMVKMLNKFAFIGSYKADIIHYFARVLKMLDKKVCVIDASEEQFLKTTIPNIDRGLFNSEVITYDEIDFFINKNTEEQYSKLNLSSKYDVVLIDFGFNLRMVKQIKEIEPIIMLTDFEKHNIFKLKKLVQYFNNINIIKVYKDLIQSKISSKYIDQLLGFNEHAFLLAEYEIYLTEQDYRTKLLCQYDDNFQFFSIQKSCKELIIDTITEYLQINSKQVKNAFKKAERRKVG